MYHSKHWVVQRLRSMDRRSGHLQNTPVFYHRHTGAHGGDCRDRKEAKMSDGAWIRLLCDANSPVSHWSHIYLFHQVLFTFFVFKPRLFVSIEIPSVHTPIYARIPYHVYQFPRGFPYYVYLFPQGFSYHVYQSPLGFLIVFNRFSSDIFAK